MPKHNYIMKHAVTISTGDGTRELSTGDAMREDCEAERLTPYLDCELLRVEGLGFRRYRQTHLRMRSLQPQAVAGDAVG